MLKHEKKIIFLPVEFNNKTRIQVELEKVCNLFSSNSHTDNDECKHKQFCHVNSRFCVNFVIVFFPRTCNVKFCNFLFLNIFN